MPSRSPLRITAVLALLLWFVLLPIVTAAQDATPSANGGVTVVASGLSAPRAFTWGPDGALYVAQSGPGTTEEATGPRSLAGPNCVGRIRRQP